MGSNEKRMTKTRNNISWMVSVQTLQNRHCFDTVSRSSKRVLSSPCKTLPLLSMKLLYRICAHKYVNALIYEKSQLAFLCFPRSPSATRLTAIQTTSSIYSIFSLENGGRCIFPMIQFCSSLLRREGLGSRKEARRSPCLMS